MFISKKNLLVLSLVGAAAFAATNVLLSFSGAEDNAKADVVSLRSLRILEKNDDLNRLESWVKNIANDNMEVKKDNTKLEDDVENLENKVENLVHDNMEVKTQLRELRDILPKSSNTSTVSSRNTTLRSRADEKVLSLQTKDASSLRENLTSLDKKVVGKSFFDGVDLSTMVLPDMSFMEVLDESSALTSLPTSGSSATASISQNETKTSLKIRDLPITYQLQEPPLTPQEIELTKKHVTVAIMTPHFFGKEYESSVMSPPCPYNCSFVNGRMQRKHYTQTADVLWYHAPSIGRSKSIIPSNRSHATQLKVIMSMESAVYYQKLAQKEFMSKFDLEVTYRSTSDIPLYYAGTYFEDFDNVFAPMKIPYQNKIHSVIYLQKNCRAKNGRHKIVQNMIDTNIIPIHTAGHCAEQLHYNTSSSSSMSKNIAKGPRIPDKGKLLSQYTFCIAMENSIDQDYITEKLWEAFSSGCIHIYYGSPNIKNIIPHPKSVVLYNDFLMEDDPALALTRELKRIMDNPQVNDEMVSWRGKAWDELSQGFQQYVQDVIGVGNTQCRVCEKALEERLRIQDF